MHSPTLALKVAAVLFSLFCIGHLFRLVGRIEVVVANHVVPWWLSIVGAAAGAVLACWMGWLARPRPSRPAPLNGPSADPGAPLMPLP